MSLSFMPDSRQMVFGMIITGLLMSAEYNSSCNIKDIVEIGASVEIAGIAMLVSNVVLGLFSDIKMIADHRTFKAVFSSAFGMTMGAIFWFYGKDTQFAYIPLVLTVAQTAGLVPLAMGASIGGILTSLRIGELNKAFIYAPYTKQIVSLTATGITACVLHFNTKKTNLLISAISTRLGYVFGQYVVEQGHLFSPGLTGIAFMREIAIRSAITTALAIILLQRIYTTYYTSRQLQMA